MQLTPITERKYWEMLEVLPPAHHKPNEGFLVGEPTTHNEKGLPVYGSYFEISEEFFAGPNMTVEEFKAFNPTTAETGEPDEATATEFELIKQYSPEAIKAYQDLGIEDGLENFEEAYVGEYPSNEDFAQNMSEETGDIPRAGETQWPLYCIDWEWAARELMMDYSEQDAHYFRNI